MITKKEYKIAKRIVKEYEQQLKILVVSGAKRKVCPVCKNHLKKDGVNFAHKIVGTPNFEKIKN